MPNLRRRLPVGRAILLALAAAGLALALRAALSPRPPPALRGAAPQASGDETAARDPGPAEPPLEIPSPAAAASEREAAEGGEPTPARAVADPGSGAAVLPAARPARLGGRLVRASDGSGVGGARIDLHPVRDSLEPWRPDPPLAPKRTGADGSFLWEEVPAGRYVLRTRPSADLPPIRRPIALHPGQWADLVVEVPAGVTVLGTVLDDAHGRPLADARVALSVTLEGALRTDAEGRFRLAVPPAKPFAIYARAPGHALAQRRVVPPQQGSIEVHLRLARGRTVTGRVCDPAKRPLGGARVLAVADVLESPGSGWQREFSETRSDAQGRFRLPPVRRDLRPALVVEREGFGRRVLDFPPAGPDAVDFGTIVLFPAARIEGRVRAPDGRPLPGWHLLLRALAVDRGPFADAAGDEEAAGRFDERRSGSDESGRFAFEGLAPGSYRVEVRPNERGTAVARRVELGPGETRSIEIEVDPGAVIEGTITCSDGGPVPIVYVSVDPLSGGRSADVQAKRAGTTASFRAEGLTPGALYRLTLYPYPTAEDREAGRGFVVETLDPVPAGASDVHVVVRVRRTKDDG